MSVHPETHSAPHPREHVDQPAGESARVRVHADEVRASEAGRDPRDERIAQLERDMHALSHSIRSPLVALKGFAGLLEEEARDALDDNGRHFLGRISEAGRRIEWRLNDLGALLAVSERPGPRSWVDLLPLLDDLAAELKPAFDRTGARLVRPVEAPLVWCDRAQLRTALLHLLGNALQHGVTDAHPDVHVRAQQSDEATEISVIDGGVGMDAALCARAFDLFDCAGERRRCFGEGRESTGVGLALVRRVAMAHGGMAWIESEPGNGVRATISLPHP